MNQNLVRSLATVVLATAAIGATAAPVTPTFTEFGNLAGATFGGSGIPTFATAITRSGTLTLGLSATQRLSGPNLGNDGAGTFQANPGLDAQNRATWNFDYYVSDSAIGGAMMDGLSFKLLYDFDAGINTDESQLGSLDINFLTGYQNSLNSTFAFLSSNGFFNQAPAGAFNPNANGQYSFALVALNSAGGEVARSAINVNVGAAAVPEPASLSLLGLAIGGLAVARRRRKAV